MSVEAQRATAVRALVERARATVGKQLDRATLQIVLDELIALAGRHELWSADTFPAPDDGARQARYIVHEDPDGQYALYLNVMTHGKTSTPHDHTTWACIAGVSGTELNVLYRRVDDGRREGHARIVEARRVDVGPGSGVALLPDDIHSVHVMNDEEVRHLHFYGRAVEQLTGRKEYDRETDTWRIRPVGVKTRVAG